MDFFINDLDKSLKDAGIGDMKIGKFVKGYVKKFYFRVSKFQKIFDKKNELEFELFIKDLFIFKKEDDYKKFTSLLFNSLINLLKRAKKQPIDIKILNNLFI